jgi:hypothetical protein
MADAPEAQHYGQSSPYTRHGKNKISEGNFPQLPTEVDVGWLLQLQHRSFR